MIKQLIINTIKFLSRIQFLKKIYRNVFRHDLIKIEEQVFTKLMSLPEKSTEQLAAEQEELLKSMINHAYNNCRYYKKLFDETGFNISTLENFREIPFLTKDIIRENINSLTAENIKFTEFRKSNTGGSTGEPLEFYTDNNSTAVDNAHHKYLYHIMGYHKGDIIIDSGGVKIGEDLRDKKIFWIKNPPGNIWGHYSFSALYLNKTTIKYYIDKIIELKPSIIRGYPSFVNELSLYIIEKNIALPFKVKGINLTAEFCSEIQKENIRKAFGAGIFLEYGQGEKTLFCWSDGNSDELLSSPYYGYIEVVDHDGNPVNPGKEGFIVVTGLCNYAMPFIRYQTGDRGIPSEINKGIVRFKIVTGRTQDYIIDKNGGKIPLTALIFGQHFKAFKNIKQWQIVQNNPGKIDILVIKANGFTEEDSEEIRNKIIKTSDIDVNIKYVDEITVTRSGKKLFLIQNCRFN